MLVDKAIHYWSSELRDENEIHGFGPFFWINNRVLCLALFQVLQPRKDPILQPDDSPTSRTLRLTIFPLTCRSLLQGSLHADSSALPVNVLPLEPDIFAGTHSSGDGQGEQGAVHSG